ncbi:MAG: NAD(P)-binding protein [Clostridiales bacterium]|nr:NAD(P)-binding protein [Clostridiales bacterium]
MTKTIRVSRIEMPLCHDRQQVRREACRVAGIREQDVTDFRIVRQSVDARHKGDIKYSYTVDLGIKKELKYNRRSRRVQEIIPVTYRPVVSGSIPAVSPIAVIGSGPAGLFCAYLLAKNGYRPVLLERGKCVEERQADVARFWSGDKLLPESNVQFGEGGAGTFSDGKLNTLVKDKAGRNRFVLETFAAFGAPEEILYVNKPHIGTDVLRTVIINMRNEIVRLGGSIFFSSKVTDLIIEDGRLAALRIGNENRMHVSAAVLAIGHSARDTFAMLEKRGAAMEPKPFAVGLRVEHPQAMIDRNQYGMEADLSLLPTASYKLTHHAANGRSVYTFCMCPGGYVINASSEEGRLAVNGMSLHARDSGNANSAVIVSVTPEDFPDPSDPLSGAAFQRELEERAYRVGRGRIPQQRFGDFEADPDNDAFRTGGEAADSPADYDSHTSGNESGSPIVYVSRTRGEAADADLRELFPAPVREALIEGMHAFSEKIDRFDRPDAILSAVESRTSSPVRITRDDSFQSNIRGLYPCGEGAGYAGGIMSAAMDGLKTAEALMACYKPG